MRFDQVFLFSKISALAFDNRQIDIDRRQIDRQIQRKKDGQIMLNIDRYFMLYGCHNGLLSTKKTQVHRIRFFFLY